MLRKNVILVCSILSAISFNANSASFIVNDRTTFTFGGDAEMDINYKDYDHIYNNRSENYNQSGRVLASLMGEQVNSNFNVSFKIDGLFDTSGNLFIDDSWVQIGQNDGWHIRVGRLEATDVYLMGQDTFVEHTGNTSDDSYNDNGAYFYKMNEAQGRASDSGQFMIFNQFDNNVYFELAAMLGDRINLFTEGTYHGKELVSEKDAFFIRPLIKYENESFTATLAMEKNLVSDAILTSDGDVLDRTGFGGHIVYRFNDDFQLQGNIAYLDALNEKDLTTGINAIYKNFGLSYARAINDFDASSNFYDGKIKIDTVYSSYEFKEAFDLEGLKIAVGAYYSNLTDSGTNLSANFSDMSEAGGRIRIYYSFW
ncbi:carbohydrate porin (plasmid) [Photobacterium sp. DA100]|uniref:carbohydrate porin n=1 Tax=Photobacterium sp. DA100 TaxID=3027472 RepID=UPI00247978C6|nr:carbohydrate porin [Photobacterium sp. DA100]WEM45522.1 carbohydrate porin [Photobacterium sp. DA100]